MPVTTVTAATAPVAAASEPRQRELEIKLTGSAQILMQAMQCAEFKRHTQGRLRTQSLHSIYFDTPDAQLQRQGVGLRLRKRGKRWIQTIKRERAVQGALQDRDEIEQVVGLAWPSFAFLPDSDLATLFANPALRTHIAPAFSTEFRRRTRLLDLGFGTLIEVALDEGQIKADRSAPICEMELELKRGDPNALFDLAAWLCTRYELRLEFASKAERGYALLKGKTAHPARAEAIELVSDGASDDAFVTIALGCFRQLHTNVDGLLIGTDPEYLHQARVAIRRLRCAMNLFDGVVPKSVLSAQNAYFRDLGRALGEARDWDVFLTQLLPALPAEVTQSKGSAALVQAATALGSAAGVRSRQRIADPAFTTALLKFSAMLHRRAWRAVSDLETPQARTIPLALYARKVLQRYWRRANKRAAVMNPAQPSTLHALRIELKSLRYGLEFFLSLFPRKTSAQFLQQLSEIQDHLGRVNDAATVSRMTGLLRDQCVDGDSREALGSLAGYYVAIAEKEIGLALKLWKRLKQADLSWK